ncbi:MAG: hypothetical protein GXX08_05495 [Firmicutes bacterium]|nr:hypothetical protein [Bacillota bacterium]
MGVRFARRYLDICRDLSNALQTIDGFYECVNISSENWAALGERERRQFIETLSDDVFYALGAVPVLRIGQGWVKYNKDRHVITVDDGVGCTHIVNLQ